MCPFVSLYVHKDGYVLSYTILVHALVQAKRVCLAGNEWSCTAQSGAELFGSSSSCLHGQQANGTDEGLCHNVLVNHCPSDKLLQKVSQRNRSRAGECPSCNLSCS